MRWSGWWPDGAGPFGVSLAGGRSSPGRWPCTRPRTLMASKWSGSLVGMAARSWRGDATCCPWLTSASEPPCYPATAPAYGRRRPGVPRSARSHVRATMSSGAGGFVTGTGKSNYPVATPMGAQLTEEVVREIARLLEARGFPPFSDEDIGRLHLLLYDLLYEGHEDTMRLQ